jgi:hypothetical protein
MLNPRQFFDEELNTPIRLLIRELHDTHKHGPLQRPTATITTGERPELERRGAGFLPNVLQNNVFQVGTPVLEMVQDDRTKHLVENVITDALTYWEDELSSIGRMNYQALGYDARPSTPLIAPFTVPPTPT